ncbi:hypothetical protein K438DRAFT_1014975 [Mycena galopus ATCC 62051]|nr:hypothetical protein K438DRAFT_1014975 [Mycena galopus ATCC 62051]
MSASQEFKALESLGGPSKLSRVPAIPTLRTDKDQKPVQAERIQDLKSSKCSTSMLSTLLYNCHILDRMRSALSFGLALGLSEQHCVISPPFSMAVYLLCCPLIQVWPTFHFHRSSVPFPKTIHLFHGRQRITELPICSSSARTSYSLFNRRQTNDQCVPSPSIFLASFDSLLRVGQPCGRLNFVSTVLRGDRQRMFQSNQLFRGTSA